ncbi:MAG: ABC transporter substrate-binding protein [Chloroflexota bacterium]
MIENTTLTNRNRTTIDAMQFDQFAHHAPATDDLLELADWLATNGAAHLSAIERIELAERLITRRRFLIGAGALGIGVITGCGTEEESAAPTVATEAARRTVEHVYGLVELPVSPQRMVTPYATLMDHALVLDIPLVGGTGNQNDAQSPFREYQQERYPDRLETLERVQGVSEPNFEQIAALNPDCIMYVDGGEDVYEDLSEIAPTFVLPRTYEAEVDGVTIQRENWKRNLRELAQAFGRQQQAEEFLADYDARAETLGVRLAERWGDAAFATLIPLPEVLLVNGYGQQPDGLALFGDLGLTPAPFVNPERQQLSLELIPQLEAADVLLVSLFAREGSLERDRERVAPVLESPLWQQLPAVQNNRVFDLDQELIGGSPLAAVAFLDWVEQTLLG